MEGKNQSGFTLVEVIAVFAIIGILAAIAVPRLSGFRAVATRQVCESNRAQMERAFQVYLLERGNEDIAVVANDFLNEYQLENDVCPEGGLIGFSVEDGFECSIHLDEEVVTPGGEVPYL